MSYANALKTVDFLLEVLAEADKPAPKGQETVPTKTEPAPQEEVKEEYYTSVEDDGIKVGGTLKVTMNKARLDAMWIEAELGENDTKDMYLGCIGQVMELEEDDDTVQLRWQNYDECWIPIKACIVE